MKLYFYSMIVLIITIAFKNVYSQDSNKSVFKKANAIRICVSDTNIESAKERFAEYLSEKGYKVHILSQKTKTEEKNLNSQKNNSYQLNQETKKPSLILNNKITGDTITTALSSLFNTMMGQFSARLKFYVSKDKFDKLYITITGYVSSNAFGNDFFDLKMQKAGKGSNWAQRDLFKRVNDYSLNYSNIYEIYYLEE